MPHSHRQLRLVAFASCAAVLIGACSDVQRDRVQVTPTTRKATTNADGLRDVLPPSRPERAVEAGAASASARSAEAQKIRAVRTLNAARVLLAEAENQRAKVRPFVTLGPATTIDSTGCWSLLRQYFGDVLDWATRVINRESHCSAVVNQREGCDTSGRTNSRAMGPWQICWPLHGSLAGVVGCSDPMELECNMKMARALYDAAGRRPWGG